MRLGRADALANPRQPFTVKPIAGIDPKRRRRRLEA